MEDRSCKHPAIVASSIRFPPRTTRAKRLTRTRASRSLATTLNPDAYRSADFYPIEQERVFAQGWVCVGYTSQVPEPGDIFVATVAGQPIFLTRDKAGNSTRFTTSAGTAGRCWSREDGQHDVIRCPYHSWGYALDGRLLGTPYFKGLDVPEAGAGRLPSSPRSGTSARRTTACCRSASTTWGCFVFVNLIRERARCSEWLGDLDRRLGHYPLRRPPALAPQDDQIQANWKLIAENFMEYYHLPWVHPELQHLQLQGP